MTALRDRVDLGARGYDVVVGDDAYAELQTLVRGRRRVALVTQSTVDASVGSQVRAALTEAPVEHETFFMGPGEDDKTLATVDELCRQFARWGLLRDDVVLALGGGVVGDTVGFAAASYHRGVDVVQLPTTLLAMVDSAIGGKTGVNLPEGKNLVGAFHQPIGVFADPRVLVTLPPREYACGLGEVAKYALMNSDPVLTELVTASAAALAARDETVVSQVVIRCAAIKARVVEADEYERIGTRASLNYGHTLAHALEVATGHALRHGEAVAIGLVFAAQLEAALERSGVGPDAVSRTEELLQTLGLPTVAPGGLRADDVLPLMARDKKSTGSLTFVLRGPNGIERVDDPDPAAVRKALASVGVEA